MMPPTSQPMETIGFEVDGSAFTMRVSETASGLRGLVFSGDEKVAGVQVYHRSDRDALLQTARSDRAVLRFAAAASG